MKSQVFKDEVLTGTESADQPAEEMSERHDHGKNLSEKDRIKLCAKSFISQVYDLLARHRTPRHKISSCPEPMHCKFGPATDQLRK